MNVGKNGLVFHLIGAILAIAGGELIARNFLGLGNPPLYVEDIKIEYMLKPDQDVYRFKNHIVTNHYGMRSKQFSQKREGAELRVMVFGDSVLNGGNSIDQADLATSILEKDLTEVTGVDALVGNISAGSWGPGNWLAYAEKYGFFEANIVILVISSHDYADNPTFQPLDPNTHPKVRPFSALTEAVTRYLPRYLPNSFFGPNKSETDNFAEPSSEEVEKGIEDLKRFLVMAKNSAQFLMVLQHWERDEIKIGEAKVGNVRIRDISESLEISAVSMRPYLKESLDVGKDPYRDNIHLNKVGQELIARAILENIPKNAISATRASTALYPRQDGFRCKRPLPNVSTYDWTVMM